MPELPEVQTTVNGLQSLLGKEITNIKLYTTKLRYLIPINIIKIQIINFLFISKSYYEK